MYLGRTKPTETTSSVLRSTYTGNGSTTTYALPGPVANETSIIATINGVTQQDGAYSTDGSNIIFDAAPALGDAIELRTISDVGMSYTPPDGSVVTGKIADLAVTTGKIADNSITTAKIAPGAVVQADLASGVAGTGPAFSVYSNANQTISNAVNTLITNNTETFDTANAFNNTGSTVGTAPAYSFNPQVAGYYLVIASIRDNSGGAAGNQFISWIYKNGTFYTGAINNFAGTGIVGITSVATSLIYMNGSTDYLQQYVYQNQGSNLTTNSGNTWSFFNGVLVKAA